MKGSNISKASRKLYSKLSRWISSFYQFNFAVKCWHHRTAKAKPFLCIINNSKIFWSIFCPSSTHGVNDGFFQKQLFNRLDFSRFLLFSTFSMARCQGPQNSVWTPVLNTRMHFIHCFDYSRPFLCNSKMEIILYSLQGFFDFQVSGKFFC